MQASPSALEPCPHCGEQHEATKLKCPKTDRPLPLKGRLLEGKFRFRRELGSGGMASVWLANNEGLNREVAIKLLRSEVTKNHEAVERFMSEARASAQIGSEHIAEVYDCGESPLGPYIVMEALVGHDLSELLAERGRLSPAELFPIMLEVLSALADAHNAGIVHRDLKPGNIFLHYPLPGKCKTKLMDFGVSKFLDGTGPVTTRDGILLGTPEYMAPEQLKGAGKMDTRADVFSAGAVMYRALSGEFVFRGETLAETLVSMSQGEVEPIQNLVPELPRKLVDVVHKALEVDPDLRYQSALEMAAALGELLIMADTDALDGVGAAPAEATPEPEHEALLSAPVEAELLSEATPTRSPPAFAALALLALGLGLGAWWFLRAQPDAGSQAVAAAAGQTDAQAPVEKAAPTPAEVVDETGEAMEKDAGAGAAVAAEAEEVDDSEDLVLEDPELMAPNGPEDLSDSEPAAPARPAAAPIVAPAGAYRNGELIALKARAKSSTHAAARSYCAKLSASSHLGLKGWRLANPSEARSFIGNKSVKLGTYWTSALWKGKAMTLKLPAGKKSSEKADKKAGRAFCVIRG